MTDPIHAPSLNRVVRLESRAGEVRAVVEDDFHHFRVHLRHDGKVVTQVTNDSPRSPYTLCLAAGRRLDELVGHALTVHVASFFETIDQFQQCTHQFDLACLAIAAAARGEGSRTYHLQVRDPGDGDRIAEASRDGVPLIRWVIHDGRIITPEPWAGHSLSAGFTAWCDSALEPDMAEASLALRRAIFISGGRRVVAQLDAAPHSNDRGGCWVQQPERAKQALRNVGSTLDFTGRAHELTSKDEDWLAFAED